MIVHIHPNLTSQCPIPHVQLAVRKKAQSRAILPLIPFTKAVSFDCCLTTFWVASVSAITNEGNPDEGPVYHGAGGLAHIIGDRVFLKSTNNAQ